MISGIGVAVVMFPILRRESERLALGYVASRIVESTMIGVGIISLLSVLTLRGDLAASVSANAGSLAIAGRTLVAVHNWTFLFGSGFCVGVNDVLLGYLGGSGRPGCSPESRQHRARTPWPRLVAALRLGGAYENVRSIDERMGPMAVAVDLEFDGGTLEQYDEVAELMEYEPGGAAPPGCLFHWGALTDRGLRVTDVWETKEQFEQYAQEKIGPYSQQVGLPGPPRITFYDVHNYQAASVQTN